MRRGACSALATGVAALSACYEPVFDHCEVTCGPDETCPDGFSCIEGSCRSSDRACMPAGDAGLPETIWSLAAVGDSHTCAADPDLGLWCWGDGRTGATGWDEYDRSGTPRAVGVTDVRAIGAGVDHTCVVTGAGELLCAGWNGAGELGRGEAASVPYADFEAVSIAGDPTGWTDVRAGDAFTCALRGAEVWCFGDNAFGQLGLDLSPGDGDADPEQSAEPYRVAGAFAQVAAGRAHACAVGDGGGVVCWGWNGQGAEDFLGTPSDDDQQPAPDSVGALDRCTAVAAGSDFSCALCRGGELYCWGANRDGQLGVSGGDRPEPVRIGGARLFRAIAAGTRFACAIAAGLDGGDLYCWGRGYEGQLGTGEFDLAGPTSIAPTGAWVDVTAGGRHACARRDDGQLFCWGSNADGQLGDGRVTGSHTPIEVSPGQAWTAVFAGGHHSCARRDGGSLWCFGFNADGQVGVDAAEPLITRPTLVAFELQAEVTSVGLGDDHSCAIVGGEAFCWGNDDGDGKLGQGQPTSTLDSPGRVDNPSALAWTAIAAGPSTTCALSDTVAYCWGAGELYQRGDAAGGAPVVSPVLADVVPSQNYTSLVVGNASGCSLVPGDLGGLICWGTNASGVRGDVDADAQLPSAIDASGVTAFSSVAIGFETACAIAADGGERRLHCWGDDVDGATGTGQGGQVAAPTLVAADTNWAGVTLGRHHGCGWLADGGGLCWGTGHEGELGDGVAGVSNTPVAIEGDHAWSMLAAGEQHTCGITTADELYCWGNGDFGQLGNLDSGHPEPNPVNRPE